MTWGERRVCDVDPVCMWHPHSGLQAGDEGQRCCRLPEQSQDESQGQVRGEDRVSRRRSDGAMRA